MSTIRNPVGPQPPRVYWRRRLVVGIVFVAVVVAVVLIISRCSAGAAPTNTGTNTPKPSNSSTSSTNGSGTNTGDAEACDPAKVTVEALTDAVGYDPGVVPQLSLVVKSTETKPCTFEVGTDVQEFTITSGDEVIWRSSDCQVDPAPAHSVAATRRAGLVGGHPWDRTRSSRTPAMPSASR